MSVRLPAGGLSGRDLSVTLCRRKGLDASQNDKSAHPMTNRQRDSALMKPGYFLSIFLSRSLPHVALLAACVGLYAVLPVWKEKSPYHNFGDIPSQIHAALTLVLGWLLVFRTNTAYARWWEARRLWGALVNASRNLAAKVSMLINLPDHHLAAARRDIIAFPYALRDHLREGAELGSLAGYEDSEQTSGHVPGFLVAQRYRAMRTWKHSHWIDGDEMRVIDHDLSRLLDICGGCERIRNTRIVGSYRMFARQCVLLFLLTLPWGIVNDFGWWTIPLTVITAYFMLGLEIVAEHVEEPFGLDEDDLDLDGLCDTIARTVGEIMDIKPGMTEPPVADPPVTLA